MRKRQITLKNPDQSPTIIRPDSLPPTADGSDLFELDRQEAQLLAFELAKSYKSFVDFYRDYYKLDAAEAHSRAQEHRGPGHEQNEERIRHGLPQDMSWHDLEQLADNDPEAFEKRWREIKRAALDELEKGIRSADAVEDLQPSPWDRARFIALRHSFMAEWKPTNGIEVALIEIMAQAHTLYLGWIKTLSSYMDMDMRERKPDKGEDRYWQPARVSNYQTMEQAHAMADRFNRIFLRTLRQLRDLRRYAPAVTIESAGQVNIGGQQINVAKQD